MSIQDRFRAAMAAVPSMVTIVTTTDKFGAAWGFTASSVCALSMDPPLLLVCLGKHARSHPVFVAARFFAVNILREGQEELARSFGRSGSDKFGRGDFTSGERDLPVLPETAVRVICERHDVLAGGDHSILVGRVLNTVAKAAHPLVYCHRSYWGLRGQHALSTTNGG